MPARLAGEIRRSPAWSSLGSVSGLVERPQQPAEALRTDKERFELSERAFAGLRPRGAPVQPASGPTAVSV
ncbi:MAG: hypothetical protein RJA70_4657 [Pseudomonadota bacterium]|jgi:hypothetical protein